MRRKPTISALMDSRGGMSTAAPATVKIYAPLEFDVRSVVVARDRSGPTHRRHGLDLMGWAHLPELRMDFVFRRRDREHEDPADQWATATIVPPGFRLPIPAQTLDRTDPGRRDLWVLTSEPRCQPPWRAHYAGPCGQHTKTFGQKLHGRATLGVSCRCREGVHPEVAEVEVWGYVAFERPISMRLMLKDGSRGEGPVPMDGKEMIVIASGTRTPIERQRMVVDAGRQPWISMRVSDGEGRVLCSEHTLGNNVRLGEPGLGRVSPPTGHRAEDAAADVTDPI